MGTPKPPIGTPRVPDHELIRPIGRGSYGEVWLARNIMGVWRAVKVVTRASFDSDRPFEREFAGIQRYEPISRTGEGLVPILHVGSQGEKRSFYYVMELSDPAAPIGHDPKSGPPAFDVATYQPKTLRSELKRRGHLPVEECVEIGLVLAAGLGALHKHGLVHRDVKPANIVFVQGRAKLADLGLVGEIREARTFVGTEGYIPPEGPGAPGADFFALGKVLYEAATGLSADEFPNPPAGWLTGDIQNDSLDLHEVILRACEHDPARRYRNAAQMQADLALMQSGQSVRRARQLERRVRTLRTVGLLTGLVALAATAVGVFVGYRAHLEAEHVRTATRLLSRAELAEKDARSRLAEAQLAGAGMERRTGRAGQRERALRLLREAATYHTNRAELRSETVAALALADLHEVVRGSVDGRDPAATGPANVTRRLSDELHGPSGYWCALDPELKRYTAACPDGSVRIYSWSDDRELATLAGLWSTNCFLDPFSATGDRLAGQSGDQAMVWETRTGRRIFERTAPGLSNVDMTPDGEWVALRSPDNLIQLYQVTNAAPGAVIDLGFTRGSFWFSPDSREIAVLGFGAGVIQRYGVAGGMKLGQVRLPTGITGIGAYWSPDTRGLLVAGNDFCGYYLRVADDGRKPVRLAGHSAEISSAVFHPTRPYVLTSAWDGSSRLWDLRNGRMLAQLPRGGAQPHWSTENRIGWVEIVGEGKGKLAEFQMVEPAGVQLLTEPTPGDALNLQKGPWHGTFLAEGSAFAAATYDGVRIWSENNPESRLLDLGPTRWLRLSDGGRRLWASTARGLCDLELDWRRNPASLTIRTNDCRNDLTGEWSLAQRNPDQGVIAGGADYLVAVEGHGARRLGAFEQPTTFIASSPDGQWVLSGAQFDSGLHLWQLQPWKLMRHIPGRLSAQGAFTPDSRSFIISSPAEVRRERAADGFIEWRFLPPEPEAPGTSVAISEDGALVAVTIGASEAALLDAHTGKLILQFRPLETGLISSLVFSSDGTRLAVFTQNHFGHIWDLSYLRARLRKLDLDWEPAGAPGLPAARLP